MDMMSDLKFTYCSCGSEAEMRQSVIFYASCPVPQAASDPLAALNLSPNADDSARLQAAVEALMRQGAELQDARCADFGRLKVMADCKQRCEV